jgi:hypothetical protein
MRQGRPATEKGGAAMASESDFTPLITVPRWVFSLRQLFLWTAVIAVGCVALRSASSTWVGAMFGMTFLALATAILLIIFRQGAQRAYWIGFATFGWLYIALLFVSWSFFNPTIPSDNPFQPWNLPTRQISSACYHWLYDAAFEKHFASYQAGPGMGGGMGGMPGMMGSGGGMYGGSGSMGMMPGAGSGGYVGSMVPPGPPPGPDEASFANVAHPLWAILLSAIGGCLAHWLYATGPGRTSQSPTARA